MYQKNFVHNKWAILVSKNLWIGPKNFFKICRMKRGNSCMKVISSFSRKQYIWGNLIFLAFRPFFTVGSLNSQDMISFMITTGSWNSQDMIRILRQWRYDFSGKHLYGGYCMDIVRCLCVVVKIHGFVKLL